MLIPSLDWGDGWIAASLSRRVNANSQHAPTRTRLRAKLIKKGEC